VSGAAVHPLTTMMLGDLNAEDAIVVPYYENIPIQGAR
jgi:acetolactate synthase-1/2/3 large subunit